MTHYRLADGKSGMVGLALIDIDSYRVRFPKDLIRYYKGRVIELRHVSELPGGETGWQTIKEAKDIWAGDGQRVFQGNFAERNCFNIPGPFYGAMTDTCETGPAEAPANVGLDPAGQEFLYRQPSTVEEVQQLIFAARCDPFLGYGADGNSHWSLALVREWWQGRNDLIEKGSTIPQPKEQIDRWRSYLADEAEAYLRGYAFFIEEGRLPSVHDVLPDLD